MRIAGLDPLLCCALRLALNPCLRKGLVDGSGLGHRTSRSLAKGLNMAEALPELGPAILRRNLHKGRSRAARSARRRLVCNHCGRTLVASKDCSGRLLSEGGLRQLKPMPLQVWHVIHGWLQPQCHLCVHASVLTIKATKNRRPFAMIEAPIDGFSLTLALGAGKLKGARHATQAIAHKAPNDIRVKAKLEVPLSMLLERAVGTH